MKNIITNQLVANLCNKAFEQQGLQTMDAIHLALASTAKADYFCTCDDKLFRKAQAMSSLDCKVITLLNLIPEVSK